MGQPIPFECMGICVLSPAHENEMRGYLVYLLIEKYLLILFKFSHSILEWIALSWIFLFLGILKKNSEGPVDRVIYRNYSESALIYLL